MTRATPESSHGQHPDGTAIGYLGHSGPRLKLKGCRFGRLVVESREGAQGTSPTYNVACDCGTSKVVQGCNLRTGRTTSCGGCQDPCLGCGNPTNRRRAPQKNRFGALCLPCTLKAKHREVRGRVCIGCGRNDSDKPWGSHMARICGACTRMGPRNGWHHCGAPLRADGTCRARCWWAGAPHDS